jgi:hypothetical protein
METGAWHGIDRFLIHCAISLTYPADLPGRKQGIKRIGRKNLFLVLIFALRILLVFSLLVFYFFHRLALAVAAQFGPLLVDAILRIGSRVHKIIKPYKGRRESLGSKGY